MKTAFIIFSLLIYSVLLSCNQEKARTETSSTLTFAPELQVQVYYFHTTNRCVSCNAIETATHDVISSSFPKEVENGNIAFAAINVDRNRELAKKYETAGVALKLVAPTSNEEYVVDLTRFAFAHARSYPEEFAQTLTDSITAIISRYHN